MKKVAAFCLMAIMTLTLFIGNALAFTDYSGATQYTGEVNATAVMLFDADSGTILYQKNIDQQIEPASTTKIMTCLLALENGDMNSVVTVSSKAANQAGSKITPDRPLVSGEEVVLKDLINGMMMASCNKAAVAVAEHIGDTTDGFIDMMNAKASELGMTSTHFSVPHGLHADDHYSTARDMAILTQYAMQNPQFAQIVGQSSYTMPATNKTGARDVKNTNKLLQSDNEYYYQYTTGIKTGSTPAGGDCLISSASKDGMNLICIVFGAPYEGTVRWELSKDLLEWGFDNFKTVDMATLLEKAEPLKITVENAAASDSGILEFNAPAAGAAYITLDKAIAEGIMNGANSISVETALSSDPLVAPITKDDVIGTVTYKDAGTGAVLYTGNLVAPRDVPKVGSEPSSSGATAVETQQPMLPETVTNNKNSGIWWWLLLPGALIAFLVIRLLTVNQRKRKRFRHRQPHYSYRIKKR